MPPHHSRNAADALSLADGQQVFRRLRADRDPGLRERLIVEHTWLAEQCARRFRHRGEPELDLTQVAYIGLIKAIDRYDPERGVPFHAYAIPTILGELKRHFRDTTWSVGVPRRAKELLSRLAQATDTLQQRLGRSPTVPELAEEMNVDAEAVVDAIAARGADRVRALPTEPRAAVPAEDFAASDVVETHVDAFSALSDLDERSQKILLWRFFEECTQREIGERLGIGQVQVSRLMRSALTRLRTGSGSLDG